MGIPRTTVWTRLQHDGAQGAAAGIIETHRGGDVAVSDLARRRGAAARQDADARARVVLAKYSRHTVSFEW
jgi:hypothetical protein